jgi:glycosyltransferase involved in cell wall biosynthesis
MPDGMRIAWLTPFTAGSAIGEFSQHITAELAHFAEVEIWTSDDAPLRATELPLVGYRPDSQHLSDLKGRDIAVYNLGNYVGYHGDIYHVSCKHPGVVILHDRSLQHLFSDMWLMGALPDAAHYIERMEAYYGAEGAEVARAALRGEREAPWESERDILRYPLYEEGIINALGVIVHAQGQARDIRERWLGPVTSLHLPCYAEVLRRRKMAAPRGRGRLCLLTMGHLNPNKQVHRVIEMLAGHPDLASRVEYRVVGPDGGFTAYSQGLKRLIERSTEDLHVDIVGWRADAELEREMERADIFVNLRHPNIEGSSASLMKQLAYGRPVVCFDAGFFAELPAEAVVRVPVGDFAALACALRELVSSADLRERVGAKAREFAASCTERSYAEGLLQVIDASRRVAPSLAFLDSAARELARMNVDQRLPIFDDIATDFARILPL